MKILALIFSLVISCLAQLPYRQPVIGEVQVDSQAPFVSLGASIGEFGTHDFKVSFWFKTSETLRYFDLLGNRVQGSHGNFFSVRLTGNHESLPPGRIVVEIDQDGSGTNYAAVSSDKSGFNDGQWHHVVITRKGVNLKLWVDRILRGEDNSAAVTNIAQVNDFKLGRSYTGFAVANIRFRDVRVYYDIVTNYTSPVVEAQVDSEYVPWISLGSKIGEVGTNDFSITFWFQTSDNSRYFDILGNRVQGSHGNFFCIRMTGAHESSPRGQISAEIDQDGSGTNYGAVSSSKNGFNDGKWHHVGVVREKTSLRLYIDGELSNTGASSGITNLVNLNPFKLGKSYPDFIAANIWFSDVRFYSLAVTDSIMIEIYDL